MTSAFESLEEFIRKSMRSYTDTIIDHVVKLGNLGGYERRSQRRSHGKKLTADTEPRA